MIRAEDLMMGDLLTFGECVNDKEFPVIRVTGVLEDTLFAQIDGDTGNDELDSEGLVGIPLTAEILEKNGFEKHDFKFIWTLRTKEYKVQIEWKGKTMLEIGHNFTIKDEQGRYDNATYIRGWQENIYVHELQHCLKLCEINFEIKL